MESTKNKSRTASFFNTLNSIREICGSSPLGFVRKKQLLLLGLRCLPKKYTVSPIILTAIWRVKREKGMDIINN